MPKHDIGVKIFRIRINICHLPLCRKLSGLFIDMLRFDISTPYFCEKTYQTCWKYTIPT